MHTNHDTINYGRYSRRIPLSTPAPGSRFTKIPLVPATGNRKKSRLRLDDNRKSGSGNLILEDKDAKCKENNEDDGKVKKVNRQWCDTMPYLVDRYIQYIDSEGVNGPNPGATDLPSQSECVCGIQYTRSIYVYFLLSSRKFDVKFCGCKRDAQTLVGLGLMPVTPERSRTAVHFGLMNYMVKLRDTVAVSDKAISQFYNDWYPVNKEKKMAKSIPQNLIPIYLELLEAVDVKVKAKRKFSQID